MGWEVHGIPEGTQGQRREVSVHGLLSRSSRVAALRRHLRHEEGGQRRLAERRSKARPATIESVKNILSAIFTTALNDQVVFIHACKGVKTPTVPTKPLTIITPEQFDTLYGKLPDADAQLLVETEIETGLRWGELTELR